MTIYEYLDLKKEDLEKIDPSRSYLSYRIKKSNGRRTRRIDAPLPQIKHIQTVILNRLLYRHPVGRIAHGFVKNRSPRTNAAVHVGNKYIVKFDLRNFFPSIKTQWVESILTSCLMMAPNVDAYAREDIALLAKLLTLNNKLPQGAPSSPAVTNIVCYRLDRDLYRLQKAFNCKVTRYADDITVSVNDKNNLSGIISIVKEMIHRFGFQINNEKMKVCSWYRRQKVTGIIVNQKLNTPKESWKNLRAVIHQASSGSISEKRLQQLRGQVEWLRSINPSKGAQYLAQLSNVNVMTQ